MTAWEYKVIQGIGFASETTGADTLAKKLNYHRTREGWEFVGSVTVINEKDPYLIFKIPQPKK